MNNDMEIGEARLLSVIKGIATVALRTKYGVIYYKRDGNLFLN